MLFFKKCDRHKEMLTFFGERGKKNKKNEVKERREEENLMMILGTRFPNYIYTNSRSSASATATGI